MIQAWGKGSTHVVATPLWVVPPELEYAPGAAENSMSVTSGVWGTFNPINAFIDRNKLRYQSLLDLVRPKRRKNAAAQITLTHWSNLMLKIDQNPCAFQSFEEILGILPKWPWTISHPGQNPTVSLCDTSETRPRIDSGRVMIISKSPRARSLKKLSWLNVELFERFSFSSLLCLIDSIISLAGCNQVYER